MAEITNNRQALLDRKKLIDQGATVEQADTQVPLGQPQPKAPVAEVPKQEAPTVVEPTVEEAPKIEAPKTEEVALVQPQDEQEAFELLVEKKQIDRSTPQFGNAIKRITMARGRKNNSVKKLVANFQQGLLSERDISDIEALDPELIRNFRVANEKARELIDINNTLKDDADPEVVDMSGDPDSIIQTISNMFAEQAKENLELIQNRKDLLNTPEIKASKAAVNATTEKLNANRLEQQKLEDDIRTRFELKATEGFVQAKLRKESRLLRQDEQQILNVLNSERTGLTNLLDSAKDEFDDLVSIQKLKESVTNQNLALAQFAFNLDREDAEVFRQKQLDTRTTVGNLITTRALSQLNSDQIAQLEQEGGYPTGALAAMQGRVAVVGALELQKLKNDATAKATGSDNDKIESFKFLMSLANTNPELAKQFADSIGIDDFQSALESGASFDVVGKLADIPTGETWKPDDAVSINGDQCGGFINNLLGKAGFMGDSWESKQARTNLPGDLDPTQIQPGDVFVSQDDKTPTEFGHCGAVESVNSDGTINIVESNYKRWKATGKGFVTRRTINPEGEGITGYYRNSIEPKVEVTPTDISKFNSPTFKPENLKSGSKEEKMYTEYLTQKDKVFNSENPSVEDILSWSVGGKELLGPESTALEKFQTSFGQTSKIADLIQEEGADTGPALGALRNLNPYDTDAKILNNSLRQLVPTIARGPFGEVGVLTEADVRLYASTLPNITNTEQQNKAITALTIDFLAEGYKNKLKNLASAKRDVSLFVGTYNGLKQQAADLREELKIDTLGAKDNYIYQSSNGDMVDLSKYLQDDIFINIDDMWDSIDNETQEGTTITGQ